MKSFLTLLVLFYFQIIVYSESSYEYIGVLQTGETIITYKINFNLSKDGSLSGESVTDFYGPDRTSSIISGFLNSKTNSISFKETKNTQTKSKADESSFCYIHVENLKLKQTSKKQAIQGEFTGLFLNDSICSKGKISLISSDILDVLKTKGINVDSLKNAESIDLEEIKSKFQKNTIDLKGSDTITINCRTVNLEIEVWDNFSEDKDIVNIIYNNKKIADNLEIKNKHHKISFELVKGTSILKVIALDEGETPTNTVNFLIIDGKNSTPVVARLKKGEAVYVKLRN